ncbi:hypothetical protein G3I62_27655 [Streptomyces sp. SID14446]|uniref:hypothetical protein n=1 Tax=Streptomyces sp. SID14446 TaxID=2706072 RepID=UPI0013BD1C33|nr:hypothetical protein [Streptomyces sp. SID14446]NEB32822.1 hypothetical protein [Streptomyces sp. SID14446]
MSDDDPPDNVRQLPRIGSPPPPPVPSSPPLDEADQEPASSPGPVRISAFDAPEVPHAPPPPTAGAALQSEGLSEGEQPPDAGAPRTGALSLAAILAIALAAFEGLQTWIQESGPRRAEAAAHQREMELLAAKAGADGTRHGAEADAARAKTHRGGGVQTSRDYGRSALGRGSGSSGRGGGSLGSGGPRGGGRGLFNGSPHGPGGRSGQGRAGAGLFGSGTRNGGHRGRPDSPSGRGSGGGGARQGAGLFGGGSRGPGAGGGRSNGNGKGSGGSGKGPGSPGSGGHGGGTGGGKGAGGGGAGRRSPRQAVSDWFSKGKGKGPGPAGAGGGAQQKGAAGDRSAAIQNALKKTRQSRKGGGATAPTFWEAAGDRLQDRWKNRQARTAPSTDATGKTRNGGTAGARRGNDGWSPNGRVTFGAAAFEAVNERWSKRRDRWKAQGGPRTRRPSPGTNGRTSRPGSAKAGRGGAAPGTGPRTRPDPGRSGPRTSPFDTDATASVTITVEQVDPPGTHARRWEPDAIAPSRRQLPAQGAPVLSRAPQRPAGTRPGTTRRKDPIPMPPSASSPSPVVQVTPPPANAMAGRHATEISLDGAVKALTLLTTAGMETYDDCKQLMHQARRLFTELEVMANDLANNHNITGARTVRAMGVLMESVGMLAVNAERMAKSALNAAELAEAEESAMERDYRPTQTAALDAGLAAPSARIHNEN